MNWVKVHAFSIFYHVGLEHGILVDPNVRSIKKESIHSFKWMLLVSHTVSWKKYSEGLRDLFQNVREAGLTFKTSQELQRIQGSGIPWMQGQLY